MDTNTEQRPAPPAPDEQTDLVAAGMLGLDLAEFRGMTYLAKAQYRALASTLLQVFTVAARVRA